MKMRITLNINGQDTGGPPGCHSPSKRGKPSHMPLRLPGFFLRTRDDGATHSEAAHIPGGRSVRDLVFGANDALAAALAAVSGVHGAAAPVLPYALELPVNRAFAASVALTLTALFGVGAAKTQMTGRPWLRSGFESALVGALAAAATFVAGRLVAGGLG